ncbi:MAG: hypothetical protein JWO08_4364, partial [Verrucomicrobiaceae bacterium]|nr:hypothetical protein [Verrucomicrobiaceae bacterium]
MDWIRANKSLAGILGAAIAGALGLGVILYFTYDAYATSADSLKTASGKIAKMESSKLYPSEANVEAKEEKVSAYEDEVSKLGTVLLALQSEVASKPITDTDFQAKLKQRIAEVRDRSKEALPKDFAFGFNIYTSSLPPSEATPDLNEYLDGVDSIVTAALDAGVKKIETISRSDLGVEKGAGKPKKVLAPAKPKAATTKSKKKGAKDNKPVKAPVEIAQMVERRLVTLDIEADQAPLQTFINTLASATLMKHFTVLRVLRIENERQEGPPSKAAPTTGANGLKTLDSNGLVSAAPVETEKLPVEGAAPAPKVEVITAAKAAPPDAVKVLGGELLKAHLEIDLVRFLEP